MDFLYGFKNRVGHPAKDPGDEGDLTEIDLGTKLWCKRAMMQVSESYPDPHQLDPDPTTFIGLIKL